MSPLLRALPAPCPRCATCPNGLVPAGQELLHTDRIDADSGNVSQTQSGCGRVRGSEFIGCRMSQRCLPNGTRGPVALRCVLPANVGLFLAGCQTACRGGALGL